MQIDLVTLGEILIDMFPSEMGKAIADVSAFQPKPGGAPANVAVAAARLGAVSAFIGKVGNEAFGHGLINVMKNQGVITKGMRVDEYARTTLAFIAMPDQNHAEFVFYRNPGADLQLTPAELDGSLLNDTKAFHFGSLSLVDNPAREATFEAIRMSKRCNALISCDANYRPNLWKNETEAVDRIRSVIPFLDLLKVNENELYLLSDGERDLGEACHSLLKNGPALIVVTLGIEGSYFCTQTTQGHIKAFKVNTVDATGCGDAFIAGLLYRLTRGDNWQSHLDHEKLVSHFQYANAVGALTSLNLGVIPALPTKAQVDRFLKAQNISIGDE